MSLPEHVRKSVLTPARLLAGGFAAAIAVGTALLTLPLATVDGCGLGVIEAFFTATSAVCVTGLTVIDISAVLTHFGQVVVLLLIQIGGLGVMTVTTIVAYVVGRRLALGTTLTVGETLGQPRLAAVGRLVRDVFILTGCIEGAGALGLAWALSRDYTVPQALYLGLFHSVSAFCNAGFDLFGTSLTKYVTDVPIILMIAGLIILGGLGFAVITEILHIARAALPFRRSGKAGAASQAGAADQLAPTGPAAIGRVARPRLSLHSRVVLLTTAVLLVSGTVLILALEYGNQATIGPLPFGGKLLASFFHSVTPRTAGFNSVPTGSLLPTSLLVTMLLMFIGASPGSTGGGIKTTTLTVILATVRSALRGRQDVEVGAKRLPEDTVLKAWVLAALSAGLVIAATAVLLATERAGLMDVLFEVISAFGTVGLSTGLTPHLSVTGRLLIPLVMFAGRVGPLTLAAALTTLRPSGGRTWRVPEERVTIG